MMKTLCSALCAFVLAFAAQASGKSSDAIVKLLNSRASGSRSEFREAAKIVAEDAKEGRPLQQFVIALVANDRDLPRKLRLKPETREAYLDQARDKIRRLAEEKNNALAWYLLSLETNDMAFLKRAADGENVQALNAWGTITLTEAFRNPSMETNEVASGGDQQHRRVLPRRDRRPRQSRDGGEVVCAQRRARQLIRHAELRARPAARRGR